MQQKVKNVQGAFLKGVDKNGAKCNVEFGRTTKIYLEVAHNEQTELRAWKLFGLVPLILMQKRQSGHIARAQQKMTGSLAPKNGAMLRELIASRPQE